jgi:hypothetical protein
MVNVSVPMILIESAGTYNIPCSTVLNYREIHLFKKCKAARERCRSGTKRSEVDTEMEESMLQV